MLSRSHDVIDQLDHLWDATIRGNPTSSHSLDPGIARTVRRLHTLGDAVAPDPAFAQRLWVDLSHRHSESNEESAHVSYDGTIPRFPRNDGAAVRDDGADGRTDVLPRCNRLGWQRGLAGFLTAAVLALALVAGYAAFRQQPSPSQPRLPAVSSPGAGALYAYVFNGTGESETDRWEVVPLDPMTLADRPLTGTGTTDLPGWPGILPEDWGYHLRALSADGSTFVLLESRQFVNGKVVSEAAFGVYNGRTGVERGRFNLPIYVRDIRLSRDGARLVIQGLPLATQLGTSGTGDPPTWYVVDTADGRIMTTVEPGGRDGWQSDSWIDPEARRLYRLFIPYSPKNTGPGATKLVANDLTTGEEVGRLELAEVPSGVWRTNRTYMVSGGVEYPVMAELRPGVALSPDGKTLALVHADADAVTLIDAERFAVERTEPLSRPTSWRDRLLSLLPLVLNGAAAKAPAEGTVLHAVFAADGRHLYVFGAETTWDDGNVDARSLGLRLIDLEEAEIVAGSPNLTDRFISRVLPSPNGQDLYVIASQPPDEMWSDGARIRLWRLDAATLEVQAHRDFTGSLSIDLSPALPDGKGQRPPGAG